MARIYIGNTYLVIIVVYLSKGVMMFEGTEPAERRVKRQTEDLVPEDDLAWIVMIFQLSLDPEEDKTLQQPICFGILVTKADVLTTCSCVEVSNRDHVGTVFLLVKPKTSLIWWDDDYKQVTQTRKHPHCETCAHTSYNNVALLTIDIINTIYGVVEVIPTALLLPNKRSESFRPKVDSDCFILSLVTGVATPRLGSLKVEKLNFSVWDIPSPQNDLGTMITIGSSTLDVESHSFFDTRFPGSPLMCLRNEQYIPVGIYLGLYCPNKFNLSSCNEYYQGCKDCFPKGMLHNPLVLICSWSERFEMILLFDSLFDWMDENTIAPAQPFVRKKFRQSQTSSTLPLPFVVHVILMAFMQIIVNNSFSR